jgi:hypothetical protein
MRETLRNLQWIWTRPVNLATVIDNQPKLVRFDGQDFKEFALQQSQQEANGLLSAQGEG